MTKTRSSAELLGDEPPTKRKPGPKPGPGRPIEPHRTAKVLADTEFVKLKTARLAGELVPAVEVEAAMAAMCLEIRGAMLAVPDRVGARLGDLTPTHLRVIDEEIRAALTALGERRGDA